MGKKSVELLAPAGSVESMVAAINAGADAVYMGGSRFGARAYAENAEEDRFLSAIDYVHLHGCRLYMTVNTLVKETELGQLYDFLNPYYRQGLDGAIVQDMGVFAFLREHFPLLPIHASTQMTVTGYRGARLLKEMGAAQVVTARELSLEEIRRIHEEVDIQIESFIHGALCYCYSGQCLLSSFIGGRSGNRGRCAQPCRLPYVGMDSAGGAGGGKEQYLLNLKDLCTLDILPDILEAGVYSLKIEGRMKSPRYTAGVVSVYRKYVDRYLDSGREGYRVDPADKRMLLELFDRGGFTEGYYRQHNGRDMIALGEKPAFREADQALFERIDREYVNKEKQEPIQGKVTLRVGEEAELELVLADGAGAGAVTVTGAVVSSAQNQPLTEEKLFKQMKKTGGTPFVFEGLETVIDGSCFLPVQAMNELRRQGLEALERKIVERYRRECGVDSENRLGLGDSTKEAVRTGDFDGMARDTAAEANARVEAQSSGMRAQSPETKVQSAGAEDQGAGAEAQSAEAKENGFRLYVSLENPEGLSVVLSHPDVSAVYVDSTGFGAEIWRGTVEACHQAGKECALILPRVFRREAEQYFKKQEAQLREAGFDGLVLGSLEEVDLVRSWVDRQVLPPDIARIFDFSLYTMNHLAVGEMMALGATRLTLPLELNVGEMAALGCEGKELVAYGYLPAMVSAQCIRRTLKGCSRRSARQNGGIAESAAWQGRSDRLAESAAQQNRSGRIAESAAQQSRSDRIAESATQQSRSTDLLWLRDRTGRALPVKNHCRFCYNTIYNPSPLSLIGMERQIRKLAPPVLRLSFTIEDSDRIRQVLDAYGACFLRREEAAQPVPEFTRGHMKRGVE